jgi:dolichyl-phosphate beta-glucosyltransferase
MKPISFIFPLYNSARLIPETLEKIIAYAQENKIIYEVILFDNGSTDNTFEIAQSFAKQNICIQAFHIPEKGMGLALKKGIQKARYENLFICGIDLAFGTQIIDDSCRALQEHNAAVVIGSKLHPQSQVKQGLKRRFGTHVSSLLRRLILGLKTRDPQGSIFCLKSAMLGPLDQTKSDNFFFTTELIAHCEKQKLTIHEVPVYYKPPAGAGSSVRILSDAYHYVKDLLKAKFSS